MIALVWPLSQVGLTCSHSDSGGRRVASLSAGRIWLISVAPPPAKPLDRERYDLYLGQAYEVQPNSRAVVGGPKVISIRLDWVLGGAVLVLLVTGLPPWLRARARTRSGRCLSCDYQRAASEGPCPECGVTIEEARKNAGHTGGGRGRLVRDASVCLFLCVLAASCTAWWVTAAEYRVAAAHRSQALDYSWYLVTCTPRLKGTIAVAKPGSGPDSLVAVIQRMGPGSTIVLIPGVYDLADMGRGRGLVKGLQDVWLVGSGRENTTLTMQLEQEERVRIEWVTIDCKNDEFINLRDHGSVYLRDCLVHNYNSGAGGSDSLDVSDSGACWLRTASLRARAGGTAPTAMARRWSCGAKAACSSVGRGLSTTRRSFAAARACWMGAASRAIVSGPARRRAATCSRGTPTTERTRPGLHACTKDHRDAG